MVDAADKKGVYRRSRDSDLESVRGGEWFQVGTATGWSWLRIEASFETGANSAPGLSGERSLQPLRNNARRG
jgi:hypothetical protein